MLILITICVLISHRIFMFIGVINAKLVMKFDINQRDSILNLAIIYK